MEVEATYKELHAVTEDTYSELGQHQPKKVRAESTAPETKEDVVKDGKRPTKLFIALCITVIILLVVIIALIIYNTQLSKKLNQSIPNLAIKEKEWMDLNISYAEFSKTLQENTTALTYLTQYILSLFNREEQSAPKMPDTPLLKKLNQSIQNLDRRLKECMDLNNSCTKLNKKAQENATTLTYLGKYIRSWFNGKKQKPAKPPDTQLSKNLEESIQYLDRKERECMDLNNSYGILNKTLQEYESNLIYYIDSMFEGEQQSALKGPDEKLPEVLRLSINKLAEGEKLCRDLNITNKRLRKELEENNAYYVEIIKDMEYISKDNWTECCPSNWRMFNHRCYYFSSLSDNWADAQKDCEKNQSNLVMIKSAEQQQFLNKSLMNHTGDYWIGLTDAYKEGHWQWVDGEYCNCIGANRLYWHDKEPDNWIDPNTKIDEDCALIKLNGGWHDIKCIDSQRWICEKRTSICYIKNLNDSIVASGLSEVNET